MKEVAIPLTYLTEGAFITTLGITPFLPSDELKRISAIVCAGSFFASVGLVYLNHKIYKSLKK